MIFLRTFCVRQLLMLAFFLAGVPSLCDEGGCRYGSSYNVATWEYL